MAGGCRRAGRLATQTDDDAGVKCNPNAWTCRALSGLPRRPLVFSRVHRGDDHLTERHTYTYYTYYILLLLLLIHIIITHIAILLAIACGCGVNTARRASRPVMAKGLRLGGQRRGRADVLPGLGSDRWRLSLPARREHLPRPRPWWSRDSDPPRRSLPGPTGATGSPRRAAGRWELPRRTVASSSSRSTWLSSPPRAVRPGHPGTGVVRLPCLRPQCGQAGFTWVVAVPGSLRNRPRRHRLKAQSRAGPGPAELPGELAAMTLRDMRPLHRATLTFVLGGLHCFLQRLASRRFIASASVCGDKRARLRPVRRLDRRDPARCSSWRVRRSRCLF